MVHLDYRSPRCTLVPLDYCTPWCTLVRLDHRTKALLCEHNYYVSESTAPPPPGPGPGPGLCCTMPGPGVEMADLQEVNKS